MSDESSLSLIPLLDAVESSTSTTSNVKPSTPDNATSWREAFKNNKDNYNVDGTLGPCFQILLLTHYGFHY